MRGNLAAGLLDRSETGTAGGGEAGGAADRERAVALWESVIGDARRVLEDDHPDTLLARSNLARAHRSVEATESVLADCVRVLGPDHPRTLTTRRDLARAHRAAGALPEAIAVYERAVRDSTRKLGDDHRLTRTMRGELASLRRKLVTMATPYGPGASHRVGRTAD
ncbi:tetratricopeptide repeat protein [Streptomyces niveus]|uniref:tetratricopeptide repeat protein n=1 Tax=Streptomyces niveus TaxID=193462 RepID=UPI003418BD7A